MKLQVAIATMLGALLSAPMVSLAEESSQNTLSYTRLLNRVQLRLLGRSPTLAETNEILNATDDKAREAIIQKAIDDGLNSDAFYNEMVLFGHEYTDVGNYGMSIVWQPHKNAVQLYPCPEDSKHSGRLGTINWNQGLSDSRFICDGDGGPCGSTGACEYGATCDTPEDPKNGRCVPNKCTQDSDCGHEFVCESKTGQCQVILSEVAPWWDPSTTIKLVGWAGEGHRFAPYNNSPDSDNMDCGVSVTGSKGGNTHTQQPWPKDYGKDYTVRPRCGCGPNLIYCGRGVASGNTKDHIKSLLTVYDGYYNDPNGRRSSIMQEPARLFAHIVVNDKPFDDLVLANYTVANQALQHFYVRTARQTGRFQELDDSTWWKDITDPNEWREVVVADMNPFYLKERDTKYDPRKTLDEPPGIPSAGVLTSLGASGSFLRERPRAARWLENLACRQFTPPPGSAVFPPFTGDPGSGGTCYHCHVNMDPAALHFKRFALMGTLGAGGQGIGGMAPYMWEQGITKQSPFTRWLAEFLPNTVMTPVTELDIDFNPDARFLDFLPPGMTMFGVTGDGTIGPLGFGKMLVASGKFDRCSVRRFYQRFMGFELDPAKHKLYIDKLVKVYTNGGKKMRPFIKWVMSQPRFRKGH